MTFAVQILNRKGRWAQSAEDRQDARCETPIGILNMRGVISEDMYLAGIYYRGDVQRYRSIIDPPAPIKTNFNFVTRDDPMPDHERMPVDIRMGAELTSERAAEWTDKYNRAFEALAVAGHKACRAVARMAVHGERMPDGCHTVHLIEGLTLLVDHYGLKTKARA